MSDNHFDNSDWQLGMSLPSRKETHSKKKKSKKNPPAPAAPQARRESEPPGRELNLQPERSLTLEPDKNVLPSESVVENDVAIAELAQAASEVAATALAEGVSEEERDLLWGGDEDEDGPVLTVRQRLLLFVLVPLVMLAVLIWGKIAYVHQVPELVRANVPAYASGEGFLVIKPWWFGPPVYKLDSYPPANDFTMYQTKMGNHAPLVVDPFVLWRFQQDILN